MASAAKDPVADWIFNKKGNMVKDISGNGHDGKIHGKVEWIKDGRFDNALAFEGKDGWIEVKNHKDFHFPKGTNFTLACWIKITADHGQPPMLVAKSYGPQGQKQRWYALYYANQGKQSDGDVSFFVEMLEDIVFILPQDKKLTMKNGITSWEPELKELCIYIWMGLLKVKRKVQTLMLEPTMGTYT